MNNTGHETPASTGQTIGEDQLVLSFLSAISAVSEERVSRGPSRSKMRRPLQQGDGDALCGLYAVMNGLRHALAPHGGLPLDYEAAVWKGLVRFADRKWRFASLFLHGTLAIQMLGLARHGAAAASQFTGKTLKVSQLKRKDVEQAAYRLDRVVRQLLRQGTGSILAGIEGAAFNHWTVITGVSGSTLRILDSDGSHYVKLAGCALDYRRARKGSPRYWVRIYGVIAVQERTLSPKQRQRRTISPPMMRRGQRLPSEKKKESCQ
ncbi:hypothetical protein [Aestuariivirga sp.]|uniref:hypothetical protein n=1 Tax=Aestuariivirga sp. TaxID=2650926 RepID=UPI0039E4BD6E